MAKICSWNPEALYEALFVDQIPENRMLFAAKRTDFGMVTQPNIVRSDTSGVFIMMTNSICPSDGAEMALACQRLAVP